MMNVDWTGIILDSSSPKAAWTEIFSSLLHLAGEITSPVIFHDETVVPDRILAEAAWELWEAYPLCAKRTSAELILWTGGTLVPSQGQVSETAASYVPPPHSKAVLILDALSLRELPALLGGASTRSIEPLRVGITGSECPSTTDQFAKAIGTSSRSTLGNDGKPAGFLLFGGTCHTDVVSLPFEDCAVPPAPNVVIWHSWLDDLVHLQQKNPDQIASNALTTLQSDGFWGFVNKLRQGRNLVITSDHGYGVARRFSSDVDDPAAIDILRNTFGASRCAPLSEPWQRRFMPPIVMDYNNQHVIVGQRKWKVQGPLRYICHGGMSLLEVASPWIEFGPL
jgi:hypothetical protein